MADKSAVIEALEFYADRRNWRGTLHVMSMTHPVLEDRGKRARAALKAIKVKCVKRVWHPCYCPKCKKERG